VSTASTNYASYADVHQKIATYVQKNYDYGHGIAKSIHTGQLVDLAAKKPTRAVATGTKAEKAFLQPGMDIEFSTRMSAHVKQEQSLHSNLPKAFAYVVNCWNASILVPRRIQTLIDPVHHSCERSLETDITYPKPLPLN